MAKTHPPGGTATGTSAYRTGGKEKAKVRELLFDRLPQEVRDRLVDGLVKGIPPSPLLSFPERELVSARVWVGLAVLAAIADAALWADGLARPMKDPTLSPETAAGLHFAAITLLVLGVLFALRAARQAARAPLPAGRYLFPLDLVEVRGRRLRVTSLHELSEIVVRRGARETVIVLTFEGGKELVLRPKGDEATYAAPDAKQEVEKALAMTADTERLQYLDPFAPLRLQDGWAGASDGAAPADRERGPVLVAAALVAAALVAGAAAGSAALSVGRQHLIALDDARFEAARSRGDESALRRYMAAGGPRAEKAEDALFERQKGDVEALIRHIQAGDRLAERADDKLFAAARRNDQVKAYEHYLHHGKRHADEVKATHLPAAAFAEALKSGRAGQIWDTVRQYPAHPACRRGGCGGARAT